MHKQIQWGAKMKECTQTLCDFHKSKGAQLAQMCPECDECGAKSNVLNDNCVNCWCCLKDEGYTRQGLPSLLKQQLGIQERKTQVIEIVEPVVEIHIFGVNPDDNSI
jgi:hypothetical protein